MLKYFPSKFKIITYSWNDILRRLLRIKNSTICCNIPDWTRICRRMGRLGDIFNWLVLVVLGILNKLIALYLLLWTIELRIWDILGLLKLLIRCLFWRELLLFSHSRCFIRWSIPLWGMKQLLSSLLKG